MTRLRRTIAARLKEAQNTAAMLTTFNEVDMSAVDGAARASTGRRSRRSTASASASCRSSSRPAIAALKEFPAVNAEIDGDDIVYKNYFDIGVAVGARAGWSCRSARRRPAELRRDREDASPTSARTARDGKLTLDELTGGTFTITNGGVFGSLLSTPILNPPQCGILGMHTIQERPVAVDGQIVIRPMMYLALSYDHRIIDGREAVLVPGARQGMRRGPAPAAARSLSRE